MNCPHGYALGAVCPSHFCGDGSGTYVVTEADLVRPQSAHAADPTDARFRERLASAAARIPPDVLAEITAAHKEYGWSCAAASEGQTCCLIWLSTEEAS